jgi:hypothetical protein
MRCRPGLVAGDFLQAGRGSPPLRSGWSGGADSLWWRGCCAPGGAELPQRGSGIPARGWNPGEGVRDPVMRSEGTPHSGAGARDGAAVMRRSVGTRKWRESIPRAMLWAGMRCTVGAEEEGAVGAADAGAPEACGGDAPVVRRRCDGDAADECAPEARMNCPNGAAAYQPVGGTPGIGCVTRSCVLKERRIRGCGGRVGRGGVDAAFRWNAGMAVTKYYVFWRGLRT